MTWTNLHAELAAKSFEDVLGRTNAGTMAYVRCFTPDVVEFLASNPSFAPAGWNVYRISNSADESQRTITADQAVEFRETKEQSTLLLVDTEKAGAGMDGIYSATKEIDETTFFKKALSLAGRAITRHHSKNLRRDAEVAIKRARGIGGIHSISPWTKFDFLVMVASGQKTPGELLYMLGLWPIRPDEHIEMDKALVVSRIFVERLLSGSIARLSPSQRIKSLNLLATNEQLLDLENFLRRASTQPTIDALKELAQKPQLWINSLQLVSDAESVLSIELRPWRTGRGRIARWSGLVPDNSDPANPPLFIMDPDAESSRQFSKLKVQWQVQPTTLAKGSTQYRVQIVTDMEEEIASREVTHSAKQYETCYFTNDDFILLDEDALVAAKIIVTLIGNDDITEESEEFIIKFGEAPSQEPSSAATKVRTLVEGAIELHSWEDVTEMVSAGKQLPEDTKGFVLLRTTSPRKGFKVFRPPLIRQIEEQWLAENGAIGRWRVRVRASGEQASLPEFVPMTEHFAEGASDNILGRVQTASRRFAELLAVSSAVARIYDERSTSFNLVKEYLLAWATVLEEGKPILALANTAEVQTLSGKTIGLIVLPNHPLRVAWHTAYDNLALYTTFVHNESPQNVRNEFKLLDGSAFPAFLPGITEGTSFVFADTLGFHSVGMVLDNDNEPKAAVAILSKAMSGSSSAESSPTVGQQSAAILGKELNKYLESHYMPQPLHVQALRPGDGLTVARALGHVHDKFKPSNSDEDETNTDLLIPSFVLELYPSSKQRGLAGRFIAEVREKRRRGTGVVAEQDRWMLNSLTFPGGISRPLLRWARKDILIPESPAHIAIAFDTFESRVKVTKPLPSSRPFFAYGLLSFFERTYHNQPIPHWYSAISTPTMGEKHPSDRVHTDRLIRIQKAIEKAVAGHLGDNFKLPALYTSISNEKSKSLRQLHECSDWVITLDRGAGVEYFDSPRDNQAIYDAYIIDAVPEREDLGTLQLITSTSNLDEVQNLLNTTLNQMGLSHSPRNTQFLMENLKAISGRLVMRLAGQHSPDSELIALALSHANCRVANLDDPCWLSLEHGFLIPADDVIDLIPPLTNNTKAGSQKSEDSLGSQVRPDLIYVSVGRRKGITVQFIEVKYRRHLRSARTPELLKQIDKQTQALRRRWKDWYASEATSAPLRALRKAKLARVLRFYADKAHRHHLPDNQYHSLIKEIDRWMSDDRDNSFLQDTLRDKGWVFCPDHANDTPLEISPEGWETQIFLFGPAQLSELRAPYINKNVSDDSRINTEATEDNARDKQEVMTSLPTNVVSDPYEIPSEDANRQIAQISQHLSAHTDPPIISGNFSEPRIVLGNDLISKQQANWTLTEKGNPHLLIAGLPGMGKTTCLLNISIQMLNAGVLPIIFSYHQDIDERLEKYVGSVRYIDYRGLGFNPLQVYDRNSFMPYLDVAGTMRDIFTSIYPELGDVQGERIRSAIKESFIELGWGNPSIDTSALREPSFKRFFEILKSDTKPDHGLKTLLARLTELDDYGFFNALETSQSLWEGDKPTVIRIHTTQNDTLQRAFASLVFYRLYKDMFHRGTQSRITHSIIFDEAHRAARLALLPTMAKESRKYGISLVVASQEAKDFHSSLFSAIANYLVLKLTDADAKALVKNVASSHQEKILINKIKLMDKFKALYFCEGKKKPSQIALREPHSILG